MYYTWLYRCLRIKENYLLTDSKKDLKVFSSFRYKELSHATHPDVLIMKCCPLVQHNIIQNKHLINADIS